MKKAILVMGLSLFLLPLGAEQPVQRWRMVPKHSHLEFFFEQAGSTVKGSFRVFEADYWFEPESLEGSRFDVIIDLASVNTGDPDRDGVLRSEDMFAVERWPQARFTALNMKRVGVGRYSAEAELSLRGSVKKLPFPFTLEITRKKKQRWFTLKAEVGLKRLDFGVGQGDLSDTSWVADEVKVLVDVRAKAVPE